MTVGLSGVGLAGVAVPGPVPAAPDTPWFRHIMNPESPGAYLVEITTKVEGAPYSGGKAIFGGEGIGLNGFGLGKSITSGSSDTVVLTYSDTGWTGGPADADKPNTHYDGRVEQPLAIDRVLPLVPEESPRVLRTFGSLDLYNADGALDSIQRTYLVDGQDVVVKYGPMGGTYADFAVVGRMVGEAWTVDRTRARLLLRDRRYALKKPLQTILYAGTGGIEGPVDLAGRPKPMWFGIRRNVPVPFLGNDIYQMHYRRMQRVLKVRGRGAIVTNSGLTAPDFIGLQNLSVPAGTYAVSISDAGSFLKLGTTETGQVTVDAEGDAAPDYVRSTRDIADRIIRSIAGVADEYVDIGSLDQAALSDDAVGAYFGPDRNWTFEEALDVVIGGAGGLWGHSRTGALRVWRLSPPESAGTVADLDDTNILLLRVLAPPGNRWVQQVGYQPRGIVQTSDLVGSLTDAERSYLAQPFDVATDIDTDVLARHPQALSADPFVSTFDAKAPAEALAAEILGNHGPDRLLIEVTVGRQAYLWDLAMNVRVFDSRLGLQGRPMRIVGDPTRAAPTPNVRLTLWG